jgi:ABC-type branched-subunit amino acid transport system ATPase component/branched-subunit amino acid ABC-type transport system permease component
LSDLLPYIVAGIVTGSVYALISTGLVLTYKTSGIFNFGQGALATVAAYAFYYLNVDRGINWEWSAAITVLIVGPLMGLVMERIARRLSHQRTAWKVVGTVGLILLVEGLGSLAYGPSPLPVPQFLPDGNQTFRLLGVNVQYSQATIAAIALVVVSILYILFRKSRLGIAMRAVVENPDLVDLHGQSPTRIRRTAWIIGSMLASLSGVLILPSLGLDPLTLTYLAVPAFAAAAIGMFSSIPLAFAGAIVVGVAQSVVTMYEARFPQVAGISSGIPFAILIVVMLVTPKAKLMPPSSVEQRPHLLWHGPPLLRSIAYVVVFGFLATVPLWVSVYKLSPYWIGALTTTLFILSLGLLVRTAGIVSLCTCAFAAIAAVTFSHLAVQHGVPWLAAVLLGALVAVPVGAILALPAIRLSGLFLALTTFGFALLIEQTLYSQSWMFGVSDLGLTMPRPSWASSDTAFYYVVLVVVVLAVGAIAAIHRGRLGRMLLGMGDSPKAVTMLGLNTSTSRLLAFCISAFIAGIAGVLQGAMLMNASATETSYSSFNSLLLLCVLALAPFRVPWYAIFAGVTYVIPGYIPGETTTYVMTALFGFFAIQVSAQGGPLAMPRRWRQAIERRFGKAHTTTERAKLVEPTDQAKTRLTQRHRSDTSAGIAVTDLTVRRGGLLAVNGVSLSAPMNQITGLIGPNGAGKTTLFDACSGLVRPRAGSISLHGQDLNRRRPDARARAGLGRTFQVMELCESLSVADNVALGWEARRAGVGRQLFATRSDMRLRNTAADEAMELCGITDLAGAQAGSLSIGQRRLVELARVLAGSFDMLLLDEPSSGLDTRETKRFAEVIKQVVRERGCGILFVEHDISLVLDVCEHIYVLDFGELIFQGSPEQVAASAEVQAAYLGAAVPADPLQTRTEEAGAVISQQPVGERQSHDQS